MKIEEILKIFKDFFAVNVPLGVVIVVITMILVVFGSLYRHIRTDFSLQTSKFRKNYDDIIEKYQKIDKQQTQRILSLEKRLDSKFKGGKRK